MKKIENHSFISFAKETGVCYEDLHSAYPTRLHQLVGEQNYFLKDRSTYFVYVQSGICFVDSRFPLLPGMYACLKQSNYLVTDSAAHVIIMERIGEEAPFLMGGPIEDAGRLKYIDGCTDSLLLAPPKKGMACLNHLHFPGFIVQTPHTHPSIRMGVVAKGFGECITPFGNIALEEGDVFIILPTPDGDNLYLATGMDGKKHLKGTHSFVTYIEQMDVIAFHPDSDFGPADEEHPMINRTIVNGESAKYIKEIRTK